MDPTDLTLTEQARLLERGDCSSREIVDAHLDRIARLDGKLHAFVDVYAEEARHLANAADQARRARLPLGPLHGLPICLKDLCDIAGRVGTVGSRMWASRRAEVTSATVERLLASGMIPLGKTHMVEFAFGAWGTNPLMGTPWNPWDLEAHRVPGGSSSGTGVAVAAALAPAGIGSDTGGSVRIPSAFNGLVGLKVTHGRISLQGTALLSWTLDTIGPMARCVEDCAELLRILAGPDPRDPATLGQPPLLLPDGALRGEIGGMRIALPERTQLPDFVHPAVLDALDAAARMLQARGAVVETVRLPEWYFDLARRTSAVMASEAYAQHREWIEDPAQPIGDAVRARILAARELAPGEYAESLRTMVERRRDFVDTWFARYDALLMPSVPLSAPAVAGIDETSPIPSFFTRPVNYLGLAALAMPAGLHGGLPIGIQLVGRPFGEAELLALGKALQDESGFCRLRPPGLA